MPQKVVEVTPAQKLAAQITVEIGRFRGGPVPDWVKRIAEAEEPQTEPHQAAQDDKASA